MNHSGGHVGSGGGCECVEEGVYGKSLLLPVSFAVNLKLPKNTKRFNNNKKKKFTVVVCVVPIQCVCVYVCV